jgi:peptidyl-prolyl cis-trans isomerase A (cyclophilin A)
MNAIFRSLLLASFAAAIVGASATTAAADAKHPRIAIVTTAGTIVVELDAVHAPVTTANFLHLVDRKKYDGATFYRSVNRAQEPSSEIEVIQGGLRENAPAQTIPLERTATTGLHNTDGEISMARTSDPNSGSSEFFLCIGDNTFLDSDHQPDGNGYAAFGHVVRGMDVVKAINVLPTQAEMLPTPVRIIRMRRVN